MGVLQFRKFPGGVGATGWRALLGNNAVYELKWPRGNHRIGSTPPLGWTWRTRIFYRLTVPVIP